MTLIVMLLLMTAFLGSGGLRALGRVVQRAFRRIAPGLWRPGAGMLAFGGLVVAFAAAARSEWSLALAALLVSAVFATVTRFRGAARERKPESLRVHSLNRAAERLGVMVTSSPVEVRAAHARLIREAHPDRGGSASLAAELNAARDVLLRGR